MANGDVRFTFNGLGGTEKETNAGGLSAAEKAAAYYGSDEFRSLAESQKAKAMAEAKAKYEAGLQSGHDLPVEEVMVEKYGALPVIHTSIPVLYGPVPATPSSPSSPSSDINITYAQLEENINTLKKSISTLKSSWNQETKRNINTINNSWAGKDCEAYTAKLTKMDGKVQNTIQALELLCSTYEKARDMIQSSQKAVSGSINNL